MQSNFALKMNLYFVMNDIYTITNDIVSIIRAIGDITSATNTCRIADALSNRISKLLRANTYRPCFG